MLFAISNIDLLTVGIAVAVSSILGFVVFFREPRSATNILFLIFSLVNAGWSIFNYVSYQTGINPFRLWSIRLVIFFGILHSFSFFLFVHVFPEKVLAFSRRIKFLLLPIVAIVAALTLSPLVFSGVRQASSGEVSQPIPGPGVPLFISLVAFLVISGMIILGKKVRRAPVRESTQFRYLVTGVILMFTLIIGFTIVLPIFFENTRFVPLSAVFTLPFFILTGYAIVRYNLLNIKVVAAETLMFLVVVVSFSEIIFARGPGQIAFRAASFAILLFFGILLIRSVRREVQQRERLEVLTRELDRANEVLAQTNVKLAKMDELKSEFVSMAGHQLRAPMTVIKGYISMILDGTIKGANAGIKNGLGKAMFSTEQLIKLVASLLDLSRIESGKIKYEMVEGDLAKIAGEVIDGFKAGAEKKNVALAFGNHAAAPVKFAFDQDKIREAVVNYMDNAIKYSSAGGRVVVGLDVTGSGADAWARLSVKDNGLGIKHEDIAKLFDKFSRTDEAKNFDPNGMGIGLYFAKRVVQDHGGRVWAESEGIGRGSTFSLELPLVPRPPHEME